MEWNQNLHNDQIALLLLLLLLFGDLWFFFFKLLKSHFE